MVHACQHLNGVLAESQLQKTAINLYIKSHRNKFRLPNLNKIEQIHFIVQNFPRKMYIDR